MRHAWSKFSESVGRHMSTISESLFQHTIKNVENFCHRHVVVELRVVTAKVR